MSGGAILNGSLKLSHSRMGGSVNLHKYGEREREQTEDTSGDMKEMIASCYHTFDNTRVLFYVT